MNRSTTARPHAENHCAVLRGMTNAVMHSDHLLTGTLISPVSGQCRGPCEIFFFLFFFLFFSFFFFFWSIGLDCCKRVSYANGSDAHFSRFKVFKNEHLREQREYWKGLLSINNTDVAILIFKRVNIIDDVSQLPRYNACWSVCFMAIIVDTKWRASSTPKSASSSSE